MELIILLLLSVLVHIALFVGMKRYYVNKRVVESKKKVKDESEDDGSEDDEEETYKMVLCVRTDLGMRTGKVAAQCGHAALDCYEKARKNKVTGVKSWKQYGAAKIALKLESEDHMEEIRTAAKKAGLTHYTVVDAGRTQIEAGSKTVIAIFGSIEEVNKVTGKLKLL
eukprot:TRINITY_DN26598_c0_g1_i1.p1 TRINITY_DN26598_c0_g1~~TRINITY_DN26598_c0_g1_i1.p1  ORF type:complete len:168 (+),score=56.82 TRINITY_DN26598_c0_g1_i1:57-560(+)